MARPVGTLGAAPSLTVGNMTFTDLDNLIVLFAWGSDTTMTFRKINGSSAPSAGYQVTAGKTLYIYAGKSLSNSAGSGPALFQSDNDVGYNSATALTNQVNVMGDANGKPLPNPVAYTYGENAWGKGFPVQATKYVSAKNNALTNQGIYLFGYEV